MESKNMIGGIVSLAVVVICVAAIMMPVLNDATTTEETLTNEGYYTLDAVTDETEKTIRFTQTLNTVTVDGVDLEVTSSDMTQFTVIGSDSSLVRWTIGGSSNQIRVYSSDAKLSFATTDDYTYVDFAINGSTVTVTSDRTDYETTTFTLGNTPFAINGEGTGAYTMKYADEGAYLKDDSVYLMGISVGNSFNAALGVYGTGTIEDGLALSVLYQGSSVTGDVVFSDIVGDYESASNYVDTYILYKYTASVTYNEQDVDLTYSYFIVPTEVTAELAQHLDSGEIALINAIPILIIITIMIAAVDVFITARRD